jgi:hypothetical protein
MIDCCKFETTKRGVVERRRGRSAMMQAPDFQVLLQRSRGARRVQREQEKGLPSGNHQSILSCGVKLTPDLLTGFPRNPASRRQRGYVSSSAPNHR